MSQALNHLNFPDIFLKSTGYNLTSTAVSYLKLIFKIVDKNFLSIHKLLIMIPFVGENKIHINEKTSSFFFVLKSGEKEKK